MRLITIVHDGAELVCVLNKTGETAAEINSLGLSRGYADMNELIASGAPQDIAKLNGYADGGEFPDARMFSYADCRLLAPIPVPRHDIICLGINYSSHAAEFGRQDPADPVFFSKRASITGAHNEVIDGNLGVDEQFDYEVELAVVIGKACRNVVAADVERYIFGYTVLNDFSARKLQKRHKQWFLGKSGDSFATFGPWIVTRDELPFPFELDLESRVNGEVRQHSNTRLFLHDIPKVVSILSRSITLEPGDIIATGTPSGVGLGFDPPRFLKSGDVVECEIGRVGILRNRVR